uniref:Uncharacterized protein n=1 Tax=Parascaris univalens TaxID=6257 RepID=A0A914ZNR4_PARUN
LVKEGGAFKGNLMTCEMHELQKMRIISPSSRNFSPLRNP